MNLDEMIETLIANNVSIGRAIERAISYANQEGFKVTITNITNYELTSFLKIIFENLIEEQKELENRIKQHNHTKF